MDPVIIAGMIFSIVVLILIGGFTLLFPLSRQLAALLRRRLNEPSHNSISREDAEKLAHAIQHLAVGMEALNERQDFVEKLLEGRLDAERKALEAPRRPDRPS